MHARVNAGIRLSEHLDGEDGPAMFHHACAIGLEGIVSQTARCALPLRALPALDQGQEPERAGSGACSRTMISVCLPQHLHRKTRCSLFGSSGSGERRVTCAGAPQWAQSIDAISIGMKVNGASLKPVGMAPPSQAGRDWFFEPAMSNGSRPCPEKISPALKAVSVRFQT